jgi:hypothetical protein
MEAWMPEHREKAGARRLLSAVHSVWQRLTGSLFGRDLTLVVALKVALIAALYLFLFRPALHPSQDPVATAAAVAGATSAPVNEVNR